VITAKLKSPDKRIPYHTFTDFFSLRVGLAGFFPLHPMTITEAERRQKATLTEEVKTDSQDQVEQ